MWTEILTYFNNHIYRLFVWNGCPVVSCFVWQCKKKKKKNWNFKQTNESHFSYDEAIGHSWYNKWIGLCIFTSVPFFNTALTVWGSKNEPLALTYSTFLLKKKRTRTITTTTTTKTTTKDVLLLCLSVSCSLSACYLLLPLVVRPLS